MQDKGRSGRAVVRDARTASSPRSAGRQRQGGRGNSAPRYEEGNSTRTVRAGNRGDAGRGSRRGSQQRPARDRRPEQGGQAAYKRRQAQRDRGTGQQRRPARQAGASRQTQGRQPARVPASRGFAPNAGGSGVPAYLAAALRVAKIALPVVAVLVVAAAIYFALPISIQVEGEEISVPRGTTYQGLIDQGRFAEKPGNLVAVDGSVLEEGKGNMPAVYNDGQQVALSSLVSESGDITADAGEDACEPYQAVQEPIPATTEVARDKVAEARGADVGKFNFYNGVLHVMTHPGQDGIAETRTGAISGKSASVEVQAMEPRVIENVHPTLSDDRKLMALTFDDGPEVDANGTQAILDVLAKNDVKATFFMLGSEAEKYPDIARKVVEAGHQAASHSYSHAPEHFLSETTEDDVRTQLSQARQAIGSAVGYEPTMVRPPGGNVNVEAIKAAGALADGYIGWTIDPHDYERPGAAVISKAIVEQAAPGGIVLLHDGGGDRSQTAQAIDKAIPILKGKGYTFVTIDELLEAVIEERSTGHFKES